MKKVEDKKRLKIIPIIIILCIILLIAICIKMIINIPQKKDLTLIINYTDVTSYLKNEVFRDENGAIYLGQDDIKNFYDEFIYYDEKYNQIISTSDENIIKINLDINEKEINGVKSKLNNNVIIKDEKFYIPVSELEETYNIKADYIEKTNTIVIDSLDKKLLQTETKKNVNVKNSWSSFSKTAEKVSKGETLTIAELKAEEANIIPKNWVKVRSKNGKIGYVKKDTITDEKVVRESKVVENQMNEKVSLVWDYFSEYSNAPNRNGTKIEGINVVSPSFFYLEKLGKGNLLENVDSPGENYIQWAHSNGYKVWPLISNNSMQETTSEILNDCNLRNILINNIIKYVEDYNLDGVNIDFENLKEEDKDMFSRFIIELTPQLKALGKVVSVDVTAPDGAPNWSLCFDRYTLGKVADYIMFMAYDQYGESSDKAGTTAGYDWVEVNIEKFLNQEGLSAQKLILGIPFYTRLWKENGEKLTSDAILIKEINEYIPDDVEKVWKEDLKQNYIQYEKNGATYKMWIEDTDSLKEKLSLIKKYNLQGACFWAKDFETEDIWNIIKNSLE